MPLIKTKSPEQQLHLRLALSRLRDISDLILRGKEPMLSVRLDSLIGEVEQALNNSKEA